MEVQLGNDRDSGQKASGKIDNSYSPTAKYANYVEFTGLDDLMAGSGEEGEINLLVEKQMLDGKDGYVVVVEKGTDGGGYDHARCTVK